MLPVRSGALRRSWRARCTRDRAGSRFRCGRNSQWRDGDSAPRRAHCLPCGGEVAHPQPTSIDAVVDFQNGIPFFSPLFIPRHAPVACVVFHVHQEQFRAYFRRPRSDVDRFLEKTRTRSSIADGRSSRSRRQRGSRSAAGCGYPTRSIWCRAGSTRPGTVTQSSAGQHLRSRIEHAGGAQPAHDVTVPHLLSRDT